MKMRSLRLLACSLVALLAVTCGLVLGGCSGESPEELVRQDLTARLDEVKNVDDAAIEDLLGATDTSAFEQLGVEPAEFVKALLGGFDYTIGDVAVDGDSATASVSVTCKSLTTMQSEIEDLAYDLLADPEIYTLSENEVMERVGSTMLEAIEGSETHETSYDFAYEKTDEGWEPAVDGTEFMSAIFA